MDTGQGGGHPCLINDPKHIRCQLMPFPFLLFFFLSFHFFYSTPMVTFSEASRSPLSFVWASFYGQWTSPTLRCKNGELVMFTCISNMGCLQLDVRLCNKNIWWIYSSQKILDECRPFLSYVQSLNFVFYLFFSLYSIKDEKLLKCVPLLRSSDTGINHGWD